MAQHERIRLAGTMLATAMFAAVATDACAQTPPPPTGEDDSVVLNNQLQLGDVIAGQTLNVVNAQEQVTVTTVTQGNTISGAVYNGSVTVSSTQDMRGDSVARTDIDASGDTYGVINATTQAAGNYLAASGFAANPDRAIYAYNRANEYVRAVKDYAAILADDPGSFGGYYRWDVYYNTTAGDVLLPIGYAQSQRIPVGEYLATHPQ